MGLLNLDWSIIWNIVNILVLFLLLKHFLFKPITEMMESRTAEIENNLKDAEDQKQKASELTAQYEEKLQGAHAEAAQIVSEARQRGQREYDAILKTAGQDARRSRSAPGRYGAGAGGNAAGRAGKRHRAGPAHGLQAFAKGIG